MEAQKILVVPSRITEIDGFPALPKMQQEIHAISQNHNATILNEPVRWIDMLRAITGTESYDILHFAGHLTDAGLVLGSEIISINQLIMMIQSGHNKLTFINSCSGEAAAERIASQCTSDVIYTVADIDNEDSITFAVLFYASLLTVDSYRKAFDVSETGQSIFRYLEGKLQPGQIKRGDSVTADVAELKRVLLDPYGDRGIVQRVAKLEDWYRRFAEFLPMLRSIEATYRGTTTIPTTLFYIIMATVVIGGLVLAYMAIKAGSGG